MNDSKNNEFPKLSRKEFAVFGMLIGKGEMFGLEMVKASGGELKPGTIYVTLQRMCDKGYIESREEPRSMPEIGIPRRKYWATGLGQKVYQTNVKANEFFNADFAWGGLN